MEIFDQIKDKSNQLRIQPSERVWHRLESRLDQDKGKVRISALRKWIGMAASIGLLFLVIFTISKKPNDALANVQELQSKPNASFALYTQAVTLNDVYSNSSWQKIPEGNYRKGQVVKKN
jgi:hypothetical protein